MIATVRLLVAAVLVSLVVGCGWAHTGTSPKSAIGEGTSHVELTITGLDKAQAQAFVEDLDDYGDVEKVFLKSFNQGTAVYEVEVDGCECDLPAMVAEIPAPGFKYLGRKTSVRYAAFDNTPPKVTFVKPQDGAVVKERELQVVVDVPDADVTEVTINGKAAERSGSRFSATLGLSEGANEIVVVAKDATGNEGRGQIRIGLDSTPPEVSATITVIIEGDVEPGTRVIVNGEEVKVDESGHYAARVRVKEGQKEVEIIAIDPYGNRTETMRPIGQ